MKKLSVIMLSLAMIAGFVLTSCGSGESAKEVTYDSIYEEYSQKIKDAAPGLIDEFKSEVESKSDVMELAEIANDKVSSLAEIQVEGGTKMAELMHKNGDEYSVYEDAYKKLYQVYNDEAMKIYEVYMDKYADTIPGMTDSMKQQMLDTYKESVKNMAPIAEE